MALIYIADDEPHIRRLAAIGLKDAGFETGEYGSAQLLLQAIQRQQPDAILLDWMMPDTDGMAVLQMLRKNPATRPLPIIMMTARTDEADRIAGLENGADDYITKPFSVRELAARVKAVIRRGVYLTDKSEEVLTSGDIVLNSSNRSVTKSSSEIELTQREFDVLLALMKIPGRVMTRQMLLDAVWGLHYFGDPRTVDVHIRYLRQKLEDEPDNPRYLLTVRGVGYRFADQENRERGV